MSFWSKNWRGRTSPNLNWKMYLWPSLLHSLSCKLSRNKYMLHLRAANNSSSNSCRYRSSGFFLCRSSTCNGGTPSEAEIQCQPTVDPMRAAGLPWASMEKVFVEEHEAKLHLHSAEVMWGGYLEGRDRGWCRASLCPTLKINAERVLVPCVPSALS